MNQLKLFQTANFSSWNGISYTDSIARIFNRAPQPASDVMVDLLAYRYGGNMESFLRQFPIKEFDTTAPYFWDITQSAEEQFPLVKALDSTGVLITTSSTGVTGANGSIFTLYFEKRIGVKGDVIVGNLNEVYPQIIVSEPVQVAGLWEVQVQLMAGNTTGIPVERLLPGELYTYEYSPVEKEFSRETGTVRHRDSGRITNEWTTIRKDHKVGGELLTEKMWVGYPEFDMNGKPTGKVSNRWMHREEMEFQRQFRDEKNRALVWGRSNMTDKGEYINTGKSGGVITQGAALFELLESANRISFSGKPTMDMINKAIYQLCDDGVPIEERAFVINTGLVGAEIFHEMVLSTLSGWTLMQINAEAVGAINKTKSVLNEAALAAGFQFVEFRAACGARVRVNVIPSVYDDRARHSKILIDGRPAMSRRMDIIYCGAKNDGGTTDTNVQIAQVKGHPEYHSYHSGFRNPWTGEANVGYTGTLEDAATFTKFAQFGVIVYDSTKCISLIPDVLY